jgi:hypothetical protein
VTARGQPSDVHCCTDNGLTSPMPGDLRTVQAAGSVHLRSGAACKRCIVAVCLGSLKDRRNAKAPTTVECGFAQAHAGDSLSLAVGEPFKRERNCSRARKNGARSAVTATRMAIFALRSWGASQVNTEGAQCDRLVGRELPLCRIEN